MQCVTPMFRYYERGKHSEGKIVSRQEAMQELHANPNNVRQLLYDHNRNPRSHWLYELIPCKKCWACQLNYSAEWATRITLEAQKYEHNYFITLTYSDQCVPILSKITYEEKYKELDDTVRIEEVTIENDGTWKYSLCPEHMITFLNSLRQYFHRKGHDGIKYFYCGEYGETTQRPHYHIILLNCPLDINQFYDTYVDKNFKAHWKSKELEKYWDKGMIDIAECEWSCIAYVARYCTKKLDFTQDKRVYLNQGLIPEYVRMSKGMGYDYFREHYKEIYKNDEMIMKTVKGNTGSFKPPKAFDRIMKELDPKGFKKIQESRKKAGDRARELLQSITDYTDLEMLQIKASNLQTKMSMLPRAGEW